jgi:hypothetical protein
MGWLLIIEGVPMAVGGAILGLPFLLSKQHSEGANWAIGAFLWGVISLAAGWGAIKVRTDRQHAVQSLVVAGCVLAGAAYLTLFVPESGFCPAFCLLFGLAMLANSVQLFLKAKKD